MMRRANLPNLESHNRMRRGIVAILTAALLGSGLSVLGSQPASGADLTPDSGAVVAAAYQGTTETSLPATVTVGGNVRSVAWAGVDTSTPYVTRSVVGTLDSGDTVTAKVEVVPDDLVYFIDSGDATSSAYRGVAGLAGAGGDGTLLNQTADQQYQSGQPWGYDLAGKPGGKNDWVVKNDSGSTKDSNGLYVDDNPADYVVTLPAGNYSVTIGGWEWWNSPGRTQKVELIGPDGTVTPVGGNKTLIRNAIVTVSALVNAPQSGTYRLRFSEVSGGYPVVSWIGIASVRSLVTAPVIAPASGTFTSATSVSISTPTTGAQIFYTLDGSTPTPETATAYTGPFILTASATITAVAAIGNDLSDPTIASLVITPWSATATAFKLAGGQEADNVKVTWDKVAAATRYEVYRDGDHIATSTGDTVDDYELEVGVEHVYTVRAFNGATQLAVSSPAPVTPFRPTGTATVWDNTTNGNDLGLPKGLEIGGTYYRYSASSAGGTTTISEAVSNDGFDFGADRVLTSLSDTKLEGFGAHYNDETGRVVIAAHRENASDYTDGELYLAAVEPGGDLTETFSGRPNGRDSRDMSFFVDADGTAYVISATNSNADIAIHQLTADWTDVESLVTVAFVGQSRETPEIIKNEGTYYFFSSRASGWYPSQAMFASAESLAGPWSALREIGNAATYGAQSNSVNEYGDGTFGLTAYRWGAQFQHPEPTGNYPRLLPVTFNDGFATAEYYSSVEYYPGTGLVPVQPGRFVSLGASVAVTADGASANNAEGVITDGADLAGSGFFRSGNEGSSTAYPFDVVVDLRTAARLTEIDTTTFLVNGSEAAYKYTIWGSLDGATYTRLVDGSNNNRVGYLIDEVTSTHSYRYLKMTVTGATKVKDGGGVTGWGDGLYEIAAFGTPTAVPVASVPAGRYYTAQTIALSSGDPAAEIHYTLDGSTPTAASPLYTAPLELSLLGDHTVKAVAVTGSAVSEAFTAEYSILSGETPVSLAESPAYAVVPGQTPALPATIRVNTAAGGTADAPITWDLDGMTFAKPYKSYTVYGTVDGLPGYVTGSIETLATQTVYYVDSGTGGGTSAAYLGAKWLRGAELLNSVSDQAKTGSTTWGYSGQDGLQTQSGPKEVNGLYGKNNAGNNVDYALTLAPGTYTAAFGIYEWWSAGDRQVRATLVDSVGRSIPIAQSTAGAINQNNRSASFAGTFTIPADGGGAVTLRFTNVGYQGATVTWFGIAKGAQTLDLSPDVVAAPTISPTAARVYGTAQQITIASPAGSVVYYTTDGSTPSRVNGTRYTNAFTLSSSATVNAVAVANGVSSPVTGADFIIVVQDGDYESVPVGQPWFDSDRNSIQAHGGGFLEHDDYYYWVGEDKSHNSASFNGVNLYRSTDLLNWEFVSQILRPEAAGLDCNVTGAATCKVERPKLLYNEDTDTFVLWGHWETADSYAASEVVVATSSTIDGDYEVLSHGRPGAGEVWDLEQEHAIEATVTAGTYPDFAAAETAYRAAGNTPAGHQSRDFTVYADSDGDAWLISAEAHEQLRIYPLTEDYTAVDFENSYPLFNGQSREAAAITQVDGVYYLFTSGQSGWYSNQLKYAYTTDLGDPDGWSANFNVGNNTTFKSQPTFIVQLQRTDGGSSLVYMGDRWVPSALGTSTYVWLPMEIDGATHEVKFGYTDDWSLDVETGAIVDRGAQLASQGKPAIATPSGSLSAGYTDGVADPGEPTGIAPAAAVNDGFFSTTSPYDNSHYFYPGDTSSFSWQVDLGSPQRLDRIDISWRSYNGSETYSAYVLAGSNDGVTWTTLADRSSNRTVGFTSDQIAGDYRHVRVTVSKVVNDHNGSTASWAAGLVEVQVYGTPLPDGVAITGDTVIARGASGTLQAAVSPEGTDQAVTWTSSDPSVVVVDAEGEVTGIGVGTAVISATSRMDDSVSGETTVEVTPVKPAAPATRTATAASDTSITVSWTPPADDGGAAVTAYRIYEAGAGVPVAEVGVETLTHTVTGLQLGSTHRYEIAAVNPAGEGPRTLPTVAVLLPEVPSDDGAKTVPGKGSLTTNDGWDTGLKDGTFQLTMNLWWGENGSLFKLYRDGTLVASVPLTMRSPNAQKAVVDIVGLTNGTYQFTGVLVNSKGSTATSPLTVTVTDAKPGKPVLSSDNRDNDGTFTVTANMWWGTNATSYRFLENGVVVANGALTAATPAAQVAKLNVVGKAKGTYVYTVEFVNAAGTTTSAPLTVKVTK